MSENEEEKKVKLGLAHLYAQAEVNGVAAVKVSDGEIFMLTRKLVESLIDKMEKENQDRIVMFVRSGPPPTEN